MAENNLEMKQQPTPNKQNKGPSDSKTQLLTILLIANILISIVTLAGVGYVVSKERDQANQQSEMMKNRSNFPGFNRGQGNFNGGQGLPDGAPPSTSEQGTNY